jgi:epsin
MVHITDDDFADFQAAPVTQNTTKPSNLMDLLNSTPSRPAPTSYAQPTHTQPTLKPQPNLFGTSNGFGTSTTTAPTQNLFGAAPLKPVSVALTTAAPPRNTSQGTGTGTGASVAKPSANFDDLWSMSLGSGPARPASAGAGGKSIKDLEKEKALAGLWGKSGSQANMNAGAFGSFGIPRTSGSGMMGGASSSLSNSAGTDDLLL